MLKAIRLQKAEKIVLILLLMALGSLTVASWAFYPAVESSSTKEDSRITVEGVVLKIAPTKTGGHIIIELDSTPLPVFIPRDSGASDIQSKIGPGSHIRVRGDLAEFGGRNEIKVARVTDIEILGS